ncbi:MAG: hypothetical protein A2X18_11525 [Bacteroidetes bacterium GWF2_40_14]|nr:MAG: hypothetical protein A2X18_11525 [Bacteroidetes bacterium GWF2_40_14]
MQGTPAKNQKAEIEIMIMQISCQFQLLIFYVPLNEWMPKRLMQRPSSYNTINYLRFNMTS